jgi:anti-sigma regulatory factor (Ser/Thr protein kinase)
VRPVSRVDVGAGTPEADPPAAAETVETVEMVETLEAAPAPAPAPAATGAGALGEHGGGAALDHLAASEQRRLDLPGTPSAVSIGREFTRRALADWGWIPDPPDTTRQTVAADILLMISEILANAVMHAGGARELLVDSGRATGALRLEVADAAAEVPAPPSEHRPGLPGGHGLLIVEKLSDRWGVIPGAGGKIVWAEVELTRLRDDLTVPPES